MLSFYWINFSESHINTSQPVVEKLWPDLGILLLQWCMIVGIFFQFVKTLFLIISGITLTDYPLDCVVANMLPRVLCNSCHRCVTHEFYSSAVFVFATHWPDLRNFSKYRSIKKTLQLDHVYFIYVKEFKVDKHNQLCPWKAAKRCLFCQSTH